MQGFSRFQTLRFRWNYGDGKRSLAVTCPQGCRSSFELRQKGIDSLLRFTIASANGTSIVQVERVRSNVCGCGITALLSTSGAWSTVLPLIAAAGFSTLSKAMSDPLMSPSPCFLLTATIQVREDLVFIARKDTNTRLNDYKRALTLWLEQPDVESIVLVENSGSDLSALREIADRKPGKNVEFISFTAPTFDGSLGKGYGEMLCLAHALEHSQLLSRSSRFIKVTGRYHLRNTARFLHFAQRRPDADVICDMLLNMTWADSRVFAATRDFLRTYLLPLHNEVNDSRGSNFEHVLARAVHGCMANRGVWAEPPFPFEIEGISGSQDRGWQMGLKERLALRLRHRLFARCLAVGPR